MLKMFKVAAAATCLALGLIASPAQAVFINGSLTVSDGLDAAFLPLASPGVATLLTSFHGVLPNPSGNETGGTTDFALTGGKATTNTWIFAPCPGAGCAILNEIVTSTGFTFNITSASFGGSIAFHCSAVGNCTDALTLDIDGVVSAAGFADTLFSGTLGLTGSCTGTLAACVSNYSGGYTYSLTANGTSTAPEPATLALIGVALLGLGVSRRRKQN